MLWQDGDHWSVWLVGSDPSRAWAGQPLDEETVSTEFDQGVAGRQPDSWPDVQSRAGSLWYAAGTTPDGSRLVAGETQLDADPSYVYVVLREPSGLLDVVARRTRPGFALPVELKLPHGQGWLVARKNARLSWMTYDGAGTPDAADGRWVMAGQNAALVPARANWLRVVADGASYVMRPGN